MVAESVCKSELHLDRELACGVHASFGFNSLNDEPSGGQQTGVSILITLVLYNPVGRNQLVGPGH